MLTFYICLSIGVSFICSILEAVILSLTPSYLESLKDSQPKLFKQLKLLKDDIEKPLASILTFNTIAHTIGAAGAGAKAQEVFGHEALTIFSIILTFCILVFSEIIPKSIGASSWKFLLPISVKIIRPMVFLSFPIVWLSKKISKLIKKSDDTISTAEIAAIADIGFTGGVLEETTHKAMKNLILFKNAPVKKVRTEKQKVFGIKYNLSLDEAYKAIKASSFSRVIVFGQFESDIKGYILRNQVQQAIIEEESKDLSELINSILIIPNNESLLTLFKKLIKRRDHIAAVINEDGEFDGIITLEDVFEFILDQEIFDELDPL